MSQNVDNKEGYTFKKYLWNKGYFRKEKLVIYFIFVILFIVFVLPPLIKNNSLSGFITFVILSIIFKIGYKIIMKDHFLAKGKNYQTWGKGAGAELNVKQSLEKLGKDYKIISDFQTEKGNIDFIVIGPKGIFVIEVKADKGIISYQNELLLVDGKPTIKDYLKQTMAEALYLSDLLNKKFNKKYFITGVLELPYGKIDLNSIHGQIRNIWIGGYDFHKYVINKSRNFLLYKEIESIYLYLKNI